eukprot:3175320-Pyramimonas_sp.AAC.1
MRLPPSSSLTFAQAPHPSRPPRSPIHPPAHISNAHAAMLTPAAPDPMSVAPALAAGEARPCCEPVSMPALKSFSQAFNGWSRSSLFKTTEASSAKNSPPTQHVERRGYGAQR